MEIRYQREDNYQYGVQALTRSQQERYYEATENGATGGLKKAITSVAPTQTYITPSIAQAAFENARYSYLTSKKGDSNTNLGSFWLASRCVFLYGNLYCDFGLQYESGGGLGRNILFDSRAETAICCSAVRPVVDIPLGSVTSPTSGAGTSALPYVMLEN